MVAVATPSRSQRWRRFALRWLIFFTLVYGGVALLLAAFENRLIFQPVRAAEGWVNPASANLQAEDVFLDSADGNRLHAWWCPNDANATPGHKTILVLHGNGGNLSLWAGALANWQRHMGVAALIVDYPGYGRSEGTPSEAGCYVAADSAYSWLTQTKGIPTENLLIIGESLGGGVAVDLGCRRPHGAIVLLSAFTSVPEMAQAVYPWLPARWLVRTQFNNLAKISKCPQPVLIAHGTADRIVPFAQGERLFAAANEPKAFVPLAGQDHVLDLGPDFFAALKQLLAKSRDGTAIPVK